MRTVLMALAGCGAGMVVLLAIAALDDHLTGPVRHPYRDDIPRWWW